MDPRLPWVIIALLVVLVVIVSVVAITANSGGSDSESSASDSDSSESSGSTEDSDIVTGTTEDWLAAVCQPGGYQDGTSFPGAIGGGFCQSRPNEGGRQAAVYFLQYDSEFKQDNDLAAYNMVRCSIVVADSGRRTVFAVMENTDLPLQPLAQFNITVGSCV